MTTPQTGLTPEEITALYAKMEKLESLPPEQQVKPSAETQAQIREINEQVQKMSPQQKQEFMKRQQAKMPAFRPLDMLVMLEGSLVRDFQDINRAVALAQKNQSLTLADQFAAATAKAHVAQAIASLQGVIAQATQQEDAKQKAAQPSKPSGQYL